MPEDLKTDHTPPSGLSPFGRKKVIQIADTAPACVVMSSWFAKDWTPPEAFGSLPILKICPNAPAYFAEAGHFTARDLRGIISLLRLDMDFRDPEAVYRVILSRAEDSPWVLPMLETFVIEKRYGKHSHKTNRSHKSGMIVSRLPLSKLRLKSRPDLHDRLNEICTTPVAADIAVAAFCEYAIEAYYHRLKCQAPDDMQHEALRILCFDAPATIVEAHLGELGQVDDWISHAEQIEILVEKHPEAKAETLHMHVVETLRKLAAGIGAGDAPATFEMIARIATIGAEQSAKLNIPRRTLVLGELEKIAIRANPAAISDEAVSKVSTLLAEGLIAAVRARDMAVLELEETAAELRQNIQEATTQEDFTALGTLAPRAAAARDSLGQARSAARRMRELLDALLFEVAIDSDDIAGDLRKLVAQTLIENASDAVSGARDLRHANLLEVGQEEDDRQTSNYGHSDCEEIADPDGSAIEDVKVDIGDQKTADAASAETETVLVQDSSVIARAEAAPDEPARTEPDARVSQPENTSEPSTDDVPALEMKSIFKTVLQLPDPVEADAMWVSAGDPDDASPSDPETWAVIEQDQQNEAGFAHEDAPGDPSTETDCQEIEHVVEPGLPVENLVNLIDRNLVGIACAAAEAFEAIGRGWPIKSVALQIAAASRAKYREYGPDTQKFLAIASRATGEDLDDLSSVMVLGALIGPAIFDRSSGFRDTLSNLCRGNLGQHIQHVTEAISQLDYDFPPDTDELARLSGAQRVPLKQRLSARIIQWCNSNANKSSRWPFATTFMHHIVSESGLIGAARAAIEAASPDAVKLAKKALRNLSTQSEIEDRSVEFASSINRSDVKLYPKGIEYLQRHFDEPLNLLAEWVQLAERDGSQGQKSEARLRSTIGSLQSRLEKAMQGLTEEGEKSHDALTRATALWITRRIKQALHALQGDDDDTFSTLDEALTAEHDLLPAAAREALEQPDLRYAALRDTLVENAILDPAEALKRARDEGAFETATRLSDRFAIDADMQRDMVEFSSTWLAEVEQRERSLKTLAKLDYKHQDEINRHLSWCEIALDRLRAIQNGGQTHDLADVPTQTRALDKICTSIEAYIRLDQSARIGQYRNEQNTDEAEALLGVLNSLNIEAIEDRIAQLRDGRSAATFETDLQGAMVDFTPGFLDVASASRWPDSNDGFRHALETEGPLFIEEDRRAAGLDFIETYRSITSSLALKKPLVAEIREFFEEIGFERVKMHNLIPIGRTGAWQGTLSGSIRSVRSDDWFLPPVFGSQATAGYKLLLVGPDVLPEIVTKALVSETPSILLLSGVVDAARRYEFAERLRAGAIPALLIDEALVAFTATRRHTRARTIFECGLPYGRVDPYTTDAGALPPEMFFGREEEIRGIMSKTADGCLVYGGRQLGKSALLGHVARTRHAVEDDQIIVRRDVKSLGNSEKTSEIWTHLASMLSPEVVRAGSRTAEAISRDIHAWIAKKPQGRIVCMFDEADHFMDADTRDDYPELSKLKELMEDTGRAFKVVFAGLHNVQRMHRQPNSPLAHLGEPICIGPLNRTEDDKRAAHHLVVNPMRAAGFCFESSEAVEEILSWANYYPSLVQEYMKGLLTTLHGAGSGKAYTLSHDGPLWRISSKTLFTHRGFNHIENRIREKFHLTLNLDPRYALVAYTLGRLNAEGNEHKARVTGFRTDELLEEAKVFWPKASELPSLVAFEALLEELFDLGVLGRVPVPQTKRFQYLLGSRQVVAMLGSEEDIYHALAEIEEKDPAVAYDRTIHRRRYTSVNASQSDALYSPLTDLQIERILQQDADTVQVVCGLDLLDLGKVGSALKRIAETGRLPGAGSDDIAVHLMASMRDLRSHVDGKRSSEQRMSLLVYRPETAKDAHDVISWLERQPQVLGNKLRPLIILDSSDADMRALANRRPDQSQYLAAWGAEMVRVHLHHIEKTDLDTPALRSAILEAAGGIPLETVRLIKAMRTATNPTETAKTWEVSLSVPKSILNGYLGQCLVLIELFEGEDYKTCNDLMREQTGHDLVDVGPDLISTGLVTGWKPKSAQIRYSALGALVASKIED